MISLSPVAYVAVFAYLWMTYTRSITKAISVLLRLLWQLKPQRTLLMFETQYLTQGNFSSFTAPVIAAQRGDVKAEPDTVTCDKRMLSSAVSPPRQLLSVPVEAVAGEDDCTSFLFIPFSVTRKLMSVMRELLLRNVHGRSEEREHRGPYASQRPNSSGEVIADGGGVAVEELLSSSEMESVSGRELQP
ncbi:hypothetical protein MUK42_05200 [Musa troglodytarum]|nr:hypothetical protein MUK42_05200 [Musa troglodytarum]